MAKVHKRLRKFDGSAFIVATIHDELLIECEANDAREVLEITKEVMVDIMDSLVNATEPTVPIAVEGTVTTVWTRD
jgi:DNA polymerase I-like protein with 3'-5' exonuclease and polymerase domains